MSNHSVTKLDHFWFCSNFLWLIYLVKTRAYWSSWLFTKPSQETRASCEQKRPRLVHIAKNKWLRYGNVRRILVAGICFEHTQRFWRSGVELSLSTWTIKIFQFRSNLHDPYLWRDLTKKISFSFFTNYINHKKFEQNRRWLSCFFIHFELIWHGMPR